MLYHHTRPRYDIDTDQRQDLFIIRDYLERSKDLIAALNRLEVIATARGGEDIECLVAELRHEVTELYEGISGKAARPNR